MNHANSTPLVDTWSHYLATLGTCEIFLVVLALFNLVMALFVVTTLYRIVRPIDLYEHQRGVGASGMGRDPDEGDAGQSTGNHP